MEMKAMKIDTGIKAKLSAATPEYLIQTRQGGGNKVLSYISGNTAIDMLNDAFGYAWSWEEEEHWIQESVPFFNTYSKDKNKVWFNGKEGTWDEQGPVAHVKGKLTVYMQVENGGIVEIKKDGYGSKSVLGKQNDQESIFKAAGTDALKKAASLFGVGLDLYRDENEQAYFDYINYEDPWNDKTKAEYADMLSYLEEYKTSYGVDESVFAEVIATITGDSYILTPDNIASVVAYIQNAVEGNSEATE